jgi:hypothetical protein
VQLEDKRGGRRALGEAGTTTNRREADREITEEKRMLSRAEFERVAGLVLQKRTTQATGDSTPPAPTIPSQTLSVVVPQRTLQGTAELRPATVDRLPEGALELVAISYHPSVDQPWWRQDGSPLGTGFTAQGRSIHPDAQGYELVFRHGELSDDVGFKLESVPPTASISGMEPPLRNGRPVENHRLYVIHVPTSADVGIPRSISLRMGMAAGAWTMLARRSTTVGHSGAYTLKDGANCQLLFGDPVETAGETRVTVSHNTLANWETRVSAVDLDGQEHRSARHYNAVGDLASTGGHFKSLRLDRVQEFRFEVRPYRWFEFRDVALQPAVAGAGPENSNDPSSPTSRKGSASSD